MIKGKMSGDNIYFFALTDVAINFSINQIIKFIKAGHTSKKG